MPEYDVSLEDLPALMKKHEEERRELLKETAYEAAAVGVGVIAKAAPKAFGLLRQSVHLEEGERGPEIVVDAPYAAIVELGSRPHWAPIGPLLRWAEHAGAEDPKALAYAVRFKIAQEGTKPTLFVRGSLPKLSEIWRKLIQQRLTR